MQALIYLPRNGKSPYKTILYYPGAGTINSRSSEQVMNNLGKSRVFLIDSGYALIMPIFTSTY